MENTAYHHFRQLHYQPTPLLLPTIWDARSAAASQALGFAAVGTSSAAMASMLGYADGEQMPFAELRYLVSRICASTTLPVSVDLEGGYSRDPARIAGHIAELVALGVAGINLEDSVSESGHRTQQPAAEFAETLRTIRQQLHARQLALFVNVRTDTYLLEPAGALAATLARLAGYEAAGADGIFVPGLTDLAQTSAICRATALPVNVMALPALAGFGALAAAGVRRISMGHFLFEALATRQQQLSRQMQHDQAFTSLFA